MIAERRMMAENASSERNGANRNRVASDSDDFSADRAHPVSKRLRHDRVAAIMADLDKAHGLYCPETG